mmetsp:Transcript_14498/g.54817  ORF Transcript_14498/g.54817 Transcript_14498/m.54817 type:complete len:290 (-) Transcript_14498:234-1103(-)
MFFPAAVSSSAACSSTSRVLPSWGLTNSSVKASRPSCPSSSASGCPIRGASRLSDLGAPVSPAPEAGAAGRSGLAPGVCDWVATLVARDCDEEDVVASAGSSRSPKAWADGAQEVRSAPTAASHGVAVGDVVAGGGMAKAGSTGTVPWPEGGEAWRGETSIAPRLAAAADWPGAAPSDVTPGTMPGKDGCVVMTVEEVAPWLRGDESEGLGLQPPAPGAAAAPPAAEKRSGMRIVGGPADDAAAAWGGDADEPGERPSPARRAGGLVAAAPLAGAGSCEGIPAPGPGVP